MSPKIVDKEAKRKRILKAAIQTFAQKGFQTTNMTDIASAAGIGKGTIYEYFQSKDQIFNAAYDYFLNRYHNIIINKLQYVNDPLEKLSAYFNAYIDFIENEGADIAGIILDFWIEGIRAEKESPPLSLKNMYQDSQTTLELILHECIRTRQIQPVDTKILSSIIIAALDGLTIQWLLKSQNLNIKESIGLLKETLVKGLAYSMNNLPVLDLFDQRRPFD